MVLVPEAYRNHPDLQKDYPEVRPVNGDKLADHCFMTHAQM